MNKKKVAIAIAILILIIALIIFCIFYFSKKDDKNNTTLTSTDGKFSIELPSDINYKIKKFFSFIHNITPSLFFLEREASEFQMYPISL